MIGSLADLLPSAFATLGFGEDVLSIGERIGRPRAVVVFLVDGLGYQLLGTAAGHSTFFADVVTGRRGRLDELRAPLPSTTPVSVMSLGTGLAPGQHGVVGFTVHVPGTDRVLTHIRWRDDPPVTEWTPEPTVFARAAAAGVPSAVVLPASFRGTGLTTAAYGGARFVPLVRDEDTVHLIASAVRDGAKLVFGYTPIVDAAMHQYGIDSPQWSAAVVRTAGLLGALRTALPDDTALLVTADHGGLDVPQSSRVELADEPELAAGVRFVAGEPRFRYLYTAPGAAADVLATWRSRLEGRADVLTRDEVIASDLLGTVRPEFAERIGDVAVICRDDSAVFATGWEPDEVATLVGLHGGPTGAERSIPLLSLPA